MYPKVFEGYFRKPYFRPKWPKVAQSGPKQPILTKRVQDHLDGPKWFNISSHPTLTSKLSLQLFLGTSCSFDLTPCQGKFASQAELPATMVS